MLPISGSAGKIGAIRAHRLFRAKKPQTEVLVCSGMVDMSEFCRMLPDSASLRSQY